MADLDKTRQQGWSYAAGWSYDSLSYVARAWKPREKPHRTPNGVTLVLHSVSAAADSLETAAVRCAERARNRDAGEPGLSEYERRFVVDVAAWKA